MKGLPRWFWLTSVAVLFAASVPYLFALAIQPPDSLYLGVHSNFDDHAVYAAWTKQAQEGKFFFENRFTTDTQPGRTIQLYFLAAGWLAKAVGIPLALHVFRVFFGFLALLALFKLVSSACSKEHQQSAFLLGILAMGMGFLFWRNYGFDGPIDVWQPEAFLLPSLMQNGLFCCAAWLILTVWRCILEAKDSWKPVLGGCLAVLVLTNIHTYDTLLIAIVSAGFLASMVSSKKFTGPWLWRCVLIAAGALPAVAWFVYVRSIDPVFAARAATVTVSASLGRVLLGVLPALLFAWIGLAKGGSKAAVLCSAGLLAAIAIAHAVTNYQMSALWLSAPAWIGLALAGVALCAWYKPREPIVGLLFAWVLMGAIAMYYPGLFQRKLAMLYAVPIGISAGIGLSSLIADKSKQALATAGAATLFGLSGIFWIARESMMAVRNLSNTTMHRVYWLPEAKALLSYFQQNADEGDALIAMPGVAIPDNFDHPTNYQIAIPDLNALMSGWGGVKTYCGHWSETPQYLERRQRVMNDLFSSNATIESAVRLLQDAKANYILAPKSDLAHQAGVPNEDFYASLGEVVANGANWMLIRVTGSP